MSGGDLSRGYFFCPIRVWPNSVPVDSFDLISRYDFANGVLHVSFKEPLATSLAIETHVIIRALDCRLAFYHLQSLLARWQVVEIRGDNASRRLKIVPAFE